jgi:glycosyltransferase involved in cell wall biosynthesis
VHLALVSPHYPPLRTSAAVQMRDLAIELMRQGHTATVLVPAEDAAAPWRLEEHDGVRVLWLKAPRTRDLDYVRRTLNEARLSFAMWRAFRRSALRNERFDGVVWYSPPIFFGPLVLALKRASACPGYLILRDIFPEWAVDLKLLRKGPTYAFFKAVAELQYAAADVIGVQTPSNQAFLLRWQRRGRVEVLQNWLRPMPNLGSTIAVERTPLRGRKIFAYVGNMGVAQGADIFIAVAERLADRSDLGFLFVGRGSDVPRLKAEAQARAPSNTHFHEEVDSREMPGLLSQCHVGLIALDPRHSTHNIPGKFLTYLQAGLPVLARVNAGTDLAQVIERERVGRVSTGDSVEPLVAAAEQLAENAADYGNMVRNAKALAASMFSAETAVLQIVASLTRAQRRRDAARPTLPSGGRAQ